MIKNRGTVEKQIAGKKIGFKFDMAAFEAMGDDLDLGLSGLLTSIGQGKLSTLATFLYRGAMRYAKAEKKQIDFTREDASEWLGELGFEETIKLALSCIDAPVLEEKNTQATVSEENGALQTV